MKKQGFKSRLDESLGERHKGKKKQPMKSRRKESEAMEKKDFGHKFGSVKTMKYRKKK